jgi:hypothetical protein
MKIFDNPDFYPTPEIVILKMLQNIEVRNRVILEPSAGKGDIVDALRFEGAEVLMCEKIQSLHPILQEKGNIIESDFLNLTSDKISHIKGIVMNPPFSEGVKHILHAYQIAPKGCKIVSLINTSNIDNDYTQERKELVSLITNFGTSESLGTCFESAERQTKVNVSLITIQKEGNSNYEFDGFLMDEEVEEKGEIGLMPYNLIRDLVNRYVEACKIYERSLVLGVEMNNILSGFYGNGISFSCHEDNKPKLKTQFKKDLQKAGWKFIFDKLNLKKDMTTGVKEKINAFVEDQQNIPFTMRNIYAMLEIIAATRSQTMDAALLEVFDKITLHHEENRHNVEGWKTNLHYLVGKKFILPNMCYQDKRYYKGSKIETGYGTYFELVEDLNRALCFITNVNYDSIGELKDWIRYPYKVKTADKVTFHTDYGHWKGAQEEEKKLYEKGIKFETINSTPIYGEYFEWGFFRCKAFKKGSIHFEWLDVDLWGKFNQRISQLKGYPLFEHKQETAYQKRNTGRKDEGCNNYDAPKTEAKVLFKVKI